MLSIKITSDGIKDKSWYAVYDEVIKESLKRCHNFEITHVRKVKNPIMHELLPVARNKLSIFNRTKSPMVKSVHMCQWVSQWVMI